MVAIPNETVVSDRKRSTIVHRLFVRHDFLPSVALFFVGTVWIPVATMSALLLMNVKSWWIPAGVISLALVGVLSFGLFRRLAKSEAWLTGAALTAMILFAAAAALRFYDLSWDGREYHTDAILALLHGINPIYNHVPAVDPVWAEHYPKATWYFAAFVIHWFHLFQLGKIYNFLLSFASAAYAWQFFRRLKVDLLYAAALTLAAAFSSVVVAQMLTFYVDGALGSLLTLVILAAVNLIFFPSMHDRVMLFMAGSLALAIKFTAGPYLAVIVGSSIAVRLLRRWRRNDANDRRALWADTATATSMLCVGVLLLGYDPYVTNVRQGLHPFYPVMGAGSRDIINTIVPPALLVHSYNSAERLTLSFFARTTNNPAPPCQISAPIGPGLPSSGCRVALKVPFTVNRQEVEDLSEPDTRLAGWGVFFSGVTLLSLALFLAIRGWRDHGPIVFALALTAVSAFINPQSWWARYTPQLCLLPVFLLVPALVSGRLPRTLARILCVILLLNSLVSLRSAVLWSYHRSRDFDRSLATVVNAGGPGEYWDYRRPGVYLHIDQFSGYKGVIICGALDLHTHPLPGRGFPIEGLFSKNEATLYKGSCSSATLQ